LEIEGEVEDVSVAYQQVKKLDYLRRAYV
jgi:hypothetical protein